MILTVDAGNTNIVLGGIENDKLLFLSRIATQTALMADEYAVKFSEILALYGYCAAAISSVVTPLTPVFKQAVKRLTSSKIVTVGPGIKTGVNIKIDDPAALGADLVCGAVGAMENTILRASYLILVRLPPFPLSTETGFSLAAR